MTALSSPSLTASAGRRALLVLAAAVVGVLPLAACAPMTQQQKDATELRRFCERNLQAGTACLGFHGRG